MPTDRQTGSDNIPGGEIRNTDLKDLVYSLEVKMIAPHLKIVLPAAHLRGDTLEDPLPGIHEDVVEQELVHRVPSMNKQELVDTRKWLGSILKMLDHVNDNVTKKRLKNLMDAMEKVEIEKARIEKTSTGIRKDITNIN